MCPLSLYRIISESHRKALLRGIGRKDHDINLFLNQGSSASVLLAFWAGSLFAVGTILCIVGCLAASLTSTYWMPVTLPWM